MGETSEEGSSNERKGRLTARTKDADVAGHLKEGWQQQVWEKFHTVYPAPALLFYINHLGWEITKAEQVFQPAA